MPLPYINPSRFPLHIADFIEGDDSAWLSAYVRKVQDHLRGHLGLPSGDLPYHNVYHAEAVARECVTEGRAAGLSRETLIALAGAAWFHYIVYVPGAKDNEQRSAEAMLKYGGLGIYEDAEDLAYMAIMITRDHKVSWTKPIEAFIPYALIIDADLAVLATDAALYDLNISRIRVEFAAFSDAEWRKGRVAFLRGMLGRERIYQRRTDREAAARGNMERELAALESRYLVAP